jgi:hypothetical protein
MAFASIRALVDAELAGNAQFSSWRKIPSQATAAGIWFDVSMSPGNPTPNYYIGTPNVSTALAQSTDGGVYHGTVTAGKYLKNLMALTVTAAAVPLPMILADYLMFYPFVDMSITDPQTLTTSIALPRYPTGRGVQMMAVEVAGQSGAGNPQFYVTYTNDKGASGRVTPLISCNTQTVNGTIISSSQATALSSGPFLPLQMGDQGVRSIDSITFLTADIGLISLVLVRPLVTMTMRGIDAPVERDYAIDFAVMPKIQPDAYLNFLVLPNASLAAAPIYGSATFVWE